jgi:hypothetical protein
VLKIWHVVCTRLIILKSIRLAKIIILDEEFASFLFTTLHKTFFKALNVYQVKGKLKNMGDAAKYVFTHHATMSIEGLRKAMKTLN